MSDEPEEVEKNGRLVYFIDVDLRSMHIVDWGIRESDSTEIGLDDDFHRIFLTPLQYKRFMRGRGLVDRP